MCTGEQFVQLCRLEAKINGLVQEHFDRNQCVPLAWFKQVIFAVFDIAYSSETVQHIYETAQLIYRHEFHLTLCSRG